MNWKEKLDEVNEAGWAGMKYSTLRKELRKCYKLLIFLDKILDDYLDQNARTVVKSLKEDNPPKEFLEELYKKEKNDKNRKSVIKEIENGL